MCTYSIVLVQSPSANPPGKTWSMWPPREIAVPYGVYLIRLDLSLSPVHTRPPRMARTAARTSSFCRQPGHKLFSAPLPAYDAFALWTHMSCCDIITHARLWLRIWDCCSVVRSMGAYVGCSRLEHIFDQALTDGQDLGELALNLHNASTPTSVSSQLH